MDNGLNIALLEMGAAARRAGYAEGALIVLCEQIERLDILPEDVLPSTRVQIAALKSAAQKLRAVVEAGR